MFFRVRAIPLALCNRNAIILRVRVCYANAFQYAYELGMSMLLRARSEC